MEAIRPAQHQIGSIFINAQGILGLEMFGTPVLFSQACRKVTRSFAFEALNAPDFKDASIEAAAKWWDAVLIAEFTRHASPAAGEDIRVGTEDLIGSGLIWNDVLTHFSCFPNVRMGHHRRNRRRASVSQRRQEFRSSF